jgi:hypothetical protein
MTAAIALERTPRRIAQRLDEAATELLRTANDLDAVADHPTFGAHELALRAEEQRRIGHDTRHDAARSRRSGPERLQAIRIAEGAERVADAVEALGSAWTRCPLDDGKPLLAALRDDVRAVAHAIEARHDPELSLARIALSEQREREVRRELREARRGLLADRDDLRVGLCAQRLLRAGERTLTCCAQLRAVLQRHALA